MKNIDAQREWAQMMGSVQRNEQSILKCLQQFVSLFSNLSDLSSLLYDSSQPYPLNFYRVFRRIYEDSETISNLLEKYESQSHQFLQQKDEIIAEQITFMNKIINSEEEIPNDPPHHYHSSRSNNSHSHDTNSQQYHRIAYLEGELATLKEVLERNNYEFQQEIKKYNNQFFELKETIQHYQLEMQRIQQLEFVIDELQNKNLILREERERDSMIIENMAKKIRFFEKERGGRDAFLSPRATQALALSPDAAKGLALAKSNISTYKRNL